MQFFSDDYLMHYGVKGMKWKKKKFGPGDGRPEDTNKGTEPGHFGLDKSDDWDPLKNVPNANDKAMARERRQILERKARNRRALKRYIQGKRNQDNIEDGRQLAQAKKGRGFNPTTESKNDKNYMNDRRYTWTGARYVKLRKGNGRNGFAPFK